MNKQQFRTQFWVCFRIVTLFVGLVVWPLWAMRQGIVSQEFKQGFLYCFAVVLTGLLVICAKYAPQPSPLFVDAPVRRHRRRRRRVIR